MSTYLACFEIKQAMGVGHSVHVSVEKADSDYRTRNYRAN